MSKSNQLLKDYIKDVQTAKIKAYTATQNVNLFDFAGSSPAYNDAVLAQNVVGLKINWGFLKTQIKSFFLPTKEKSELMLDCIEFINYAATTHINPDLSISEPEALEKINTLRAQIPSFKKGNITSAIVAGAICTLAIAAIIASIIFPVIPVAILVIGAIVAPIAALLTFSNTMNALNPAAERPHLASVDDLPDFIKDYKKAISQNVNDNPKDPLNDLSQAAAGLANSALGLAQAQINLKNEIINVLTDQNNSPSPLASPTTVTQVASSEIQQQ